MNGKEYRQNKRTIALKIGAIVLAVILLVSALLFVAELFESKRSEYTGAAPSLDQTLSYNGHKYELKDNIETILVLGLDKFENDNDTSYNIVRHSNTLMLMRHLYLKPR